MALWLVVTTSKGKELVNMDTVCNVEPDPDGGAKLWWFGADADNSIEIEETVADLKTATGAVGKSA